MPGSTINYTSAGTLRVIGIVMIAIASVAFTSRLAARYHLLGWQLQLEDLFVALGFVFFLAMSIAYILVIEPVYRLADFQNGDSEIYATLLQDADLVVKVYFCTTMLLWLCLWSIKLAFLFLYRRLVNGLPHYIRWWWAIMIFCILTFIGAIISNFTSCASFKEWFTPGQCTSRRDEVAQIVSLYYAFVVDVLSDLMIMILPLKLIWNLQVSRPQKIGIGATFALASLCIVAALVRVISVGSRSGVSTPSSSWLALWAMVEGAIAIIVASLPSFAIAIKRSYSTRQAYASNSAGNRASRRRHDDVQLRTIGSAPQLAPQRSIWSVNAGGSSQEDILQKTDKIAVVRTTHVDTSDVDSMAERYVRR